jgi:hypothetical protein
MGAIRFLRSCAGLPAEPPPMPAAGARRGPRVVLMDREYRAGRSIVTLAQVGALAIT